MIAPNLLFIENVGNLICPVPYDLGEDLKVALLSVPEGDDKPFKYPAVFASASVTVVTKADLLPQCTFDVQAVKTQLACLNPDAVFLVTSAKSGSGIAAFAALLLERLAAKRRGLAKRPSAPVLSADARHEPPS